MATKQIDIEWSANLIKLAAADSDLAVGRAEGPAQERYARVHAAIMKDSWSMVALGLKYPSSDVLGQLAWDVVAEYRSPEATPPRMLEIEAAAVQLWRYYHSTAMDLLWFLCAQESPAFALEAFLDGQRYTTNRSDAKGTTLALADGVVPSDRLIDRADRMFRAALATATATAAADARAVAERRWIAANAVERSLLAAVFLDPAWIDEVLADELANPGQCLVITTEMLVRATRHDDVVAFLRSDDGASYVVSIPQLLGQRTESRAALLGAALQGRFGSKRAARMSPESLGATWKPLVVAAANVTGVPELVEGMLDVFQHFHGLKLASKYDAGLPVSKCIRANASDALVSIARRRASGEGGAWADELQADLVGFATPTAVTNSAVRDAVIHDLTTRLLDDPENVEVLAVLADRLQADDDPRGELIALQLALANPPHAGPASPNDEVIARRDARLASFALPIDRNDRCVWGIGFVRRLELYDVDSARLAKLTAIWRNPSMRLLSELAVGFASRYAGRSAAQLVGVIPTSLRRLELGHAVPSYRLPRLTDIVAALPRLTTLSVVGLLDADRLAHPALRRLELGLSDRKGQTELASTLGRLSQAQLPGLVELALRLADPDETRAVCAAVVASGWLGRLSRLAIHNGRRNEFAALEQALSSHDLELHSSSNHADIVVTRAKR